MIDSLGLGIGLKGGLALAAVLMAAYLLFTWLRLRQLKKRKTAKAGKVGKGTKAARPAAKIPASPLTAASTAEDADAADDDDEMLDAMVYSRPRAMAPGQSSQTSQSPINDPGFAALLGESQERQQPVRTAEVQALREEVSSLRQTLADLQEELDRVKAAQNVSPLYNEAIGLAQHGIDVEGIAARCGISVAEAQLVAALTGKQNQPDEIDDLYGDDYELERQHGSSGKRYAAA